MPLGDVPGIAVRQRRSCGFQDVEKQVYAIRKICPKDEACTGLFYERAHPLHLAVPAGGANHHRLAAPDHGLDIRQHRVRRGEVDDHIDGAKVLSRQPRCIFILRASDALHLMPALARDLGDQGPGLAATEYHDI